MELSALTEICAEIAIRIADFFSKNQEKRKSGKLVQEMRKSEQYDFSDDEASPEWDTNSPQEGGMENKLKGIKKNY